MAGEKPRQTIASAKFVVERLALLPPEAARIVGAELEKLGIRRHELRGRLEQANQTLKLTEALLAAMGSRRRFFVPTADPVKRGRILGRAAERMLDVLEASSPESVRDRVKSLIHSITVEADGRVVVEGTYEPLVLAEMPVLADASGKCAQCGCLGNGPLMEQWITSPAGRRWRITLTAAA